LLGADHYFFERGGGIAKNISSQTAEKKKHRARGTAGKISRFCLLMWKRFSLKLLPTKTIHAQPEGAPQLWPSLPPQKNENPFVPNLNCLFSYNALGCHAMGRSIA